MKKSTGNGDTTTAIGLGAVIAGVAIANPLLAAAGVFYLAFGVGKNRPDPKRIGGDREDDK